MADIMHNMLGVRWGASATSGPCMVRRMVRRRALDRAVDRAVRMMVRQGQILAMTVILGAAFPGLGSTGAQAQTAASLMADQVYVDDAGRLVAIGGVEVWNGSVRMTAQRVVFDQRRDTLIVDGPVSISDGPDTVLLADSAEISPDLRAGMIRSARIVLNQQLQISAASISRDANGLNQMDAVVASTCRVCAANPTPLWEIRGERMTLDEATNQMEFEGAQFRFSGVPILYVPRLRMPGPGLVRSRGMLRPEVSLGSDLGLTVGIPYFFPIGDRYDVTLTPAASTNGMVSLGFRWRMARVNGGLEIGGQISSDNIRPGEIRGYGYARALFALSNDFTLSADALVASDRTYLETYDITDDSRLLGHLTLERVRRDQMIRGRVLGFYSLRAGDVNDELPNLATQAELDQRIGLSTTPIGGELRVQLGAQAYQRRSSVDGARGRDLARAFVQLGWRRSTVLPGGILAAGAVDGRIEHVRVSDDSAFAAPVTRRAVQAMVEFRWPWARSSDRGARSVIEPIVQVIGARASGGALPNDDHTMPELDEGNLFALTRYSGEDARDDVSRINAGLRWSRYQAGGWSSEALVGRIWRRQAYAGFPPAHVQALGQTASDWLLAGRVSNASGLSLSARLLIDPTSTLSRAETNLSWTDGASSVATRYLFVPASAFESRATDLNEVSVDFTRRFYSGWASSFGWDYDIAQNLFATARAGFEFRNECLSFDVSMSRNFVTATNPTSSTRFNLSVELLGIGGRAPSNPDRDCRA